MNRTILSHGPQRAVVLCACIRACTALACHRIPPSLVAEVLPLRDSGYVLVDSAAGALGNDSETYREVALDSGGTYVLLAECDCQGMSIGVAPSSFWRTVAPYHLVPDFLDEAYSQAPRLRFVVSETRRHLIRIRMSDCAQRQFRDGEWTSESAVCTYGLYLLKEPETPRRPASPRAPASLSLLVSSPLQTTGGSMSPRSVVTTLTTTLTATLVTASLGQGPRAASTFWQDARVAAVARLDSGQRIQVEGLAAERLTGTFLRSSDGMLSLHADGGERTLPIADMTGLWVRGSSWKTGALVGGAILGGAAAVLVIVCAADNSCDFDDSASSNPSVGDIVAGVAIVGAVGAVTGALIGAVIPKWHRRYP